MTPYCGIAANTALRDAALLRNALSDVNKGQQQRLAALSGYKREIIRYGLSAVQASPTQMQRLDAESPIITFATKALFRLLDLSPALQNRLLDLRD
jgi:salicylate hydroxylase